MERGWTGFTHAGVNLDYFGYGPFGLINLDRQVEKQLKLQFLALVKRHTDLRQTTLFEYRYNLADDQAQLALDELLSKTLTLSPSELRNLPTGIDSDLTFSNLDRSEFLAANSSAVEKSIVAADEGDSRSTGGHLGTLLWRFQGHEGQTTHNLTVAHDQTSQGAKTGNYRIRDYHHSSKVNSLIEPLKESKSVSLRSLSDSDMADGIRDFSINWFVTDKWLTGDEVRDYSTLDFECHIQSLKKIRAIASFPVGSLSPSRTPFFKPCNACPPTNDKLYFTRLWHA